MPTVLTPTTATGDAGLGRPASDPGADVGLLPGRHADQSAEALRADDRGRRAPTATCWSGPGDERLATAGTGDVLTGTIAAPIALGRHRRTAAAGALPVSVGLPISVQAPGHLRRRRRQPRLADCFIDIPNPALSQDAGSLHPGDKAGPGWAEVAGKMTCHTRHAAVHVRTWTLWKHTTCGPNLVARRQCVVVKADGYGHGPRTSPVAVAAGDRPGRRPGRRGPGVARCRHRTPRSWCCPNRRRMPVGLRLRRRSGTARSTPPRIAAVCGRGRVGRRDGSAWLARHRHALRRLATMPTRSTWVSASDAVWSSRHVHPPGCRR